MKTKPRKAHPYPPCWIPSDIQAQLQVLDFAQAVMKQMKVPREAEHLLNSAVRAVARLEGCLSFPRDPLSDPPPLTPPQ